MSSPAGGHKHRSSTGTPMAPLLRGLAPRPGAPSTLTCPSVLSSPPRTAARAPPATSRGPCYPHALVPTSSPAIMSLSLSTARMLATSVRAPQQPSEPLPAGFAPEHSRVSIPGLRDLRHRRRIAPLASVP
ncbi:hypothetical protein ZWY2020_035692 [Hordeum vulgare]|nr:hypothetical protein ZWY2020_035692 [Hordeum vulgare]